MRKRFILMYCLLYILATTTRAEAAARESRDHVPEVQDRRPAGHPDQVLVRHSTATGTGTGALRQLVKSRDLHVASIIIHLSQLHVCACT